MSGTFLAQIADRVLNRPLLIHPAKAETIFGVLEGRITLDAASAGAGLPEAPDAARFKGGYQKPSGERTRFTRVSGNTALVSATGSLVNRGAWIGANSGLTSYEGLGAQIDEIAADAEIKHVVLDIDSYGGEATGMAGLAAKIRGLRKSKYVVAVINDVAASAGYGIASSADEIVVSPTSIVGSIGVVMMHLDRSAEMAAKGVRPTLIHAGAKKVDGNPFGPLPDNVRSDMQKDVLAFYDQFLGVVEQGRAFAKDARRKSRLPADKARATEADTFIGEEAIALGLADRMASLDEVLAELSRPARSAGSPSTRRTMKMERMDLPEANAGGHSDTALRAAIAKAENDGKTVGMEEGRKAGHAEGVKAERERIAAIINSDEGRARPKAAIALAFAVESPSAETAKSLLASIPAEAPGAAAPSGAVTQTIAQRAAEGQEIGAGGKPEGAAPEAVQKGWAKAFKR